MRLVLLTSDSPCQRALANRFVATPGVTVAGVVVQRISTTMRPDSVRRMARRQPALLASKVLQRVLYGRLLGRIAAAERTWFGRDGSPLPWPAGATVTEVADVNGAEAVAAIAEAAPDVIAVSGTRIVRDPVFDLAPAKGLLNLHTGLSPYYKGGPNCTLWCLANRQPEMIGVTVHWLDRGIDTGGVILSSHVPAEPDDELQDLVWRTVARGHDAYVDVVRTMAQGATPGSTPQAELGSGRTYYTREWTVRRLAAAHRFVRTGGVRRWVQSGRPVPDGVRTVSLTAD